MNSFAEELDTDYIGTSFPYQEKWIWEDNDTAPLLGESDDEWDVRVDELLMPTNFGNLPLTMDESGEMFHLITDGAKKEKYGFL